MKKIFALLLTFAVCFTVTSCGSNEASNESKREPYESFAWGISHDELYSGLISLGIDYETDYKENVYYEVENFCGINGLDIPACFGFSGGDSLSGVVLAGNSTGNEELNSMIDALKATYGPPLTEDDSQIRGIRNFSIKWDNYESNISFVGAGTSFMLTFSPKE